MKKILLLAGVVAAMASCTKNEVVDVNMDNPNLINFTTYTGSATKGADVTSENIVDGNVGVYAVADTGTDFSAYTIPNTMLSATTNGYNDDDNSGTGDTFSTPVSGQWTSSASYYWPIDPATVYDFYAYYPFTDVADKGAQITNAGVLTDTAENFTLATTAADQIDILAGGNTTIAAQSSTVMLTLNHMLSKVDFQIGVKSEVDGSAIKVMIHDISLSGIASTHGGLDLYNKKLADPTAAQTYTTAYTYGGANTENATFDMAAIDETYATDGTAGTNTWTPACSLEGSSPYYWTLDDSGVFDVTDAYVSEGATNLIGTDSKKIAPSYFSIDAYDSTDSEPVDAFKLLPQTLTADVQQVSLTYSITQNGQDIVGVNEYDYTVTYYTSDDYQASSLEVNADLETSTPSITAGEQEFTNVDKATYDAAVAAAAAKTTVEIEDTNYYTTVTGVTWGNTSTKITKTFDLRTTNVEAWAAGSSYLYTITFIAQDGGIDDATRIEFDVVASDWGAIDDEELN
ncbi:MAG: fimbrillin family protein [Rikenellaceae bacterium]